MFTFLHTADIHLDSPLHSLERYDGAPVEEVRLASRRALVNLVHLAIDENVAFVLIAGDLYDGDWKDYNTGLFFLSQMAKLKEAGISVYLIAGNHDAANKMTRTLPWPDNVHLFDSKKPEKRQHPATGAVIHGQSFAAPRVTDDLAAKYLPADPGCFNIGLLHTSLDGRPGHDSYAPCSVAGLCAHQYDYWALGHVHAREVVEEKPLIVFPGNTQGRHIREDGPRGCFLVDVEDNHNASLRFVPTDVVRWAVCTIDIEGASHHDEVEERFESEARRLLEGAGERILGLRVRLTGRGGVFDHVAGRIEEWKPRFRSIAIEIGSDALWIEKVEARAQVEARTTPYSAGPAGELISYLDEVRSNGSLLAELSEDFSSLRIKIAAELMPGSECPDPRNPDTLRTILDEVEPLLKDRLLSGGAR